MSPNQRYLILVAPAANRVFAGQAADLAAAELEICASAASLQVSDIGNRELAGIDYLGFELAAAQDARWLHTIAGLSSTYAIFELVDGDLLRPLELINTDRFSDDLVTIPKYQGKTNEQFTRMMVNVTAAAVRRRSGAADERLQLLDPLCGRGTTLSVGLMLGYDVAGVESQQKSVEAYAAFLKSYLRRKRIKHKADFNPVRREGRSLGRRLQVEVTPPTGGPAQQLTVFTGDTRQSAALYGKRKFDLVVTDAPYGVVHDSPGKGKSGSAAQLLSEAIGVWAGQLKSGGALGLSWNTYRIGREELSSIMINNGLEPLNDGPYLRFAHRVDASINRDILVGRRS
ncbi:site-specific DNA-methyltransferase [Microlunatus elymi]|uniref:Site-specific DNA-methyltransferase n=1 Tax=Microlunatus elymi TaxID=2596828 RepID=A0A516PVG4_9ACTN|nr:site-specific DNA-methyltransferase [Microlunatus elymi]QDP95188.1 site-specific DNA-methyltransferase [Microlunatus elymi]